MTGGILAWFWRCTACGRDMMASHAGAFHGCMWCGSMPALLLRAPWPFPFRRLGWQ